MARDLGIQPVLNRPFYFLSYNGDVYEGDYIDGKRQGRGTFRSANGKILQQGRWENGKFTGA